MDMAHCRKPGAFLLQQGGSQVGIKTPQFWSQLQIQILALPIIKYVILRKILFASMSHSFIL